jgi:hypothetical protein
VKIVRSWPENVPPNRNYVVDNLPKFVMGDYSYRGLGDLNDDVLLIEWDMAISKEDLELFIEHVREQPDRVLVTPYRIYQDTAGTELLPKPIWVHRRFRLPDEDSARHVTEDDQTAHLWALGVTYLPRFVIRGFLERWPGHFNDVSLSGWHYRNIAPEVRIDWDVRPVHLHYPIEDIATRVDDTQETPEYALSVDQMRLEKRETAMAVARVRRGEEY